MKRITELTILRWAVVVLFAMQIVQFVRFSNAASAAAPGGSQPSIGQPRMTAGPAATSAPLADRVGALEARLNGLISYANRTQNQLEDFYNAYLHHKHSVTALGMYAKDDYVYNSSYLALSNICTRPAGAGTIPVVVLAPAFPSDWRNTGPPLRSP